MTKKIVVGVCGGIAAYKAIDLVSSLRKLDYQIDVIMTDAAQHFVTPLSFHALTGRPVYTGMFDENTGDPLVHINLAQNSDLIVIVPATANVMAKVASGIADDLLTSTILAADCPVIFFPAMNVKMWENPATVLNVAILGDLGYDVYDPAEGILACGDIGKGKLPAVADILDYIQTAVLSEKQDLSALNILVSAGPTEEIIDPVRYISNRSSGKMGYELAKAAAYRGGNVVLVSGPVWLTPPPNVDLIKVKSTAEMEQELLKSYDNADIVIMAAAVADYRLKEPADNKIKKDGAGLTLELIPNNDILRTMGQTKKEQFLVGFCAETENLVENGLAKIKAKKADMLVCNDVSRKDAGFDVDTNAITVILSDNKILPEKFGTKGEIANYILDIILDERSKKERI